jgi:hypothetical protein
MVGSPGIGMSLDKLSDSFLAPESEPLLRLRIHGHNFSRAIDRDPSTDWTHQIAKGWKDSIFTTSHAGHGLIRALHGY